MSWFKPGFFTILEVGDIASWKGASKDVGELLFLFLNLDPPTAEGTTCEYPTERENDVVVVVDQLDEFFEGWS